MKLKSEKLPLNFAFNCNLGHYTEAETERRREGVENEGARMGEMTRRAEADAGAASDHRRATERREKALEKGEAAMAGRCRLTPR